MERLIEGNMGKPVYEIDGARFGTLEGFFDEISRVVIPGAEWGRNLDAFNDILRGGFGTPPEGFVLRWKRYALSREKLSYDETIRQLEASLRRCHPSSRRMLERQLTDARRHMGPTTCDLLVTIIREHGVGGREADDGVELVLE